MIEFRRLLPGDRETFFRYFQGLPERSCEYSFANLCIWGRQRVHFGENYLTLFSQFDRFGQGFLQAFLRGLYTFLWTLLFLIPGIVKSYAYAMTPFLMAEDPNLSAKEAIKLSQEKMRGHKGELFWLGLTFFGWSILAALTGGIGYIFLNPYMNAAYAAFYRDQISPKTAVHAYAEVIPQIEYPN